MNTVLVDKESINDIADCLRNNQVVAFPTETVFGLGVCFGSVLSLDALYSIKHRDRTKAITLMVSNVNDIEKYGVVDQKINTIIHAFMPGKITIILKKQNHISKDFTSHRETIGIRIPDDPFVLALLDKVGPMLVTSANLSGCDAMSKDQQVYHQFAGKIAMIVRGNTNSTTASTVVDLSKGDITIVREGVISKGDIMGVIK